jgi:hypothetical protein
MSATTVFNDDQFQEWVGSRDLQGRYWGFRVWGWCKKFEYINNFQPVYDWRLVDAPEAPR